MRIRSSLKHMTLFPVILMAGITTLGCSARSPLVEATPVAGTDIVIDGNGDEWNGRYIILENEPLAIAAGRRGDQVMLAIKSRDRGLINRAASQGFTLWLDTRGKKRKRVGLQFQGWRAQYAPQTMMNPGRDRKALRGAAVEALTGPMPLVNVDGDGNRSLKALAGSAVGSLAGGEWFCEFQIDLNQLSDDAAIEILGVGLEVQAPERPSGSMRGGPPGGGRPGGDMAGGMGGRAGGGHGGGGQRPQAGMASVKSDLIWIRIRL